MPRCDKQDMIEINSICVFCGSANGRNPAYVAAAERLGADMAAHGIRLVYGGGNVGLMGATARAVMAHGGKVTGIIPEFLVSRERMLDGVDELHVVPDMHTRKRMMFEAADAFVTLPGGIGTLEELSEILVSRYLNRHDKPLVLVNQDGFYDDLLKFFERMTRENFKTAGLERVLRVVPDVESVWAALERPDAFEVDALWR